jgi:hypothetical protein
MGGPQRLPKTKEERDFDKLMRDRRPSVWEDKGSVGDARFRSLKVSAKLHQDHLGAGSDRLLPPLAGSISDKEQRGGADETHGAGASAPHAAQRAPRRHGCVSLCRACFRSDRTIAVSGYLKARKLPVTGSCASFTALV